MIPPCLRFFFEGKLITDYQVRCGDSPDDVIRGRNVMIMSGRTSFLAAKHFQGSVPVLLKIYFDAFQQG